MATAAKNHIPSAHSAAPVIPDIQEAKQIVPANEALETTVKTASATGQQWLTRTTETKLGDGGLDAAKSVHTRVSTNTSLDSTYSEAAVFTEKTPEGSKERSFTVSKTVNIADPDPKLNAELAEAKSWSQDNDTADLQKLARSGVQVQDSLSTVVTGPNGKEEKSTDTRTFNKDGSVTLSHEDSLSSTVKGNSRTVVITQTNHNDKTFSASGAAVGSHTYATKSTKESEYGADGWMHSATHTDVIPTQPLPPLAESQQGLAPHVSQSLEQHLSQNGYSAHDAAQTVRDIGPQLAQAITEHAIGGGGSLEFHQSGPIAVSLASSQAEPQPGVVSVPMDQLKAVHESGFAQNLSQTLARVSGPEPLQACREM